jgi:hypothetical protein
MQISRIRLVWGFLCQAASTPFLCSKKWARPIRWQGQGFRLDHSSRGTAHGIDSAYSAGLWLQAIPPRKLIVCDVSAPLSYGNPFFFHAKVQGSGGSWIDSKFRLASITVRIQRNAAAGIHEIRAVLPEEGSHFLALWTPPQLAASSSSNCKRGLNSPRRAAC